MNGTGFHKNTHIVMEDDWTPTSANINALPEKVREFIHNLQTDYDPAGTIHENVMLREQTLQLNAMIERMKKEVSPTADAVSLLGRYDYAVASLSAEMNDGWDEDGRRVELEREVEVLRSELLALLTNGINK